MSGGINQIGLNNSLVTTSESVAEKTGAGLVGQSQGQEVQSQPTQQSLVQQAVADSAEEITMAFQDKSADRLKRRDTRSRSAGRINEMLAKYLKGVGDVKAAEKFEELAESLKQLGKPTPQQIQDLLEKFQKESGLEDQQAAVLLALEELFSAESPDSDTLGAIRQAKTELGQHLQEFYQQHIKTCDDVADVYEHILGEHGEDDFPGATGTLISRLGADLQAESASVDLPKVKTTLDSLYHLQVARNTFSSFARLFSKMQSAF